MTQQQPMTRADRAEQIAYLDALAVEAKAAAAVFRAALESEAGDEYRREKTRPSWTVPGLGTVSGRVKHPAVRVADPDDFLAWVKAHRPEDVETVPATERVRPATANAILAGCTLNGDGLLITANGDEIAGVEYIPGGDFEGIAVKIDPQAKETYRELARTALAQIGLSPESAMTAPAAPAGVPDPWAVPVGVPDPWSVPAAPASASDPWAISN